MFSKHKNSFSHGRRLIIPALFVFLMFLLVISTTVDLKRAIYQSFTKRLKSYGEKVNSNTYLLEDVLNSNSMPNPGRTIFFHETTCNNPDSKFREMNLTARQACAIESAALNNPNFEVFVLFTCPSYRPERGVPRNLIDAIKSYGNVNLRQLDLWAFSANTPIEDWVKKGKLLNSSYPMQHTADLLRLISLYRFGGIYLDMDVVVLRSLENVPLNYLGAHDNVTVGNAVISLEPKGKGHEFAELMLQNYQEYYNGENYVNNGPSLVTRVVRKICGTDLVKAMQEGRKSCQGLQVFNSTAFYALPWTDWTHYTKPEYFEDTMEKTKDSYLIHLWNKASYNGLIKVGSNTAYGKYAEKHCPKAYAAAGEYF